MFCCSGGAPGLTNILCDFILQSGHAQGATSVGEIGRASITLFAVTTIFGWGYYGERCWQFLVGVRAIFPYRLLWCAGAYAGAVTQLDFAWQLADTLNALMALPNLISLLALSPVIVQLTRRELASAIAVQPAAPGST